MRTTGSPWHLADGVRATVPHRLAGGAVVQLWRPGPPPHLEGWYGPGRTFAAAAGIDADELVFLGRIDGPSGPRWLYRHAGGGEVLVDVGGRPWRAVACPRRRSGHRVEPLGVAAAVDVLRSAAAARAAHPAGPGLADVLPFRRR